jgi:hypothetical protein
MLENKNAECRKYLSILKQQFMNCPLVMILSLGQTVETDHSKRTKIPGDKNLKANRSKRQHFVDFKNQSF